MHNKNNDWNIECVVLSASPHEKRKKKRARIWLRRESRRIEWDRSGTVVQCLDSNYIRLNHILYTCLPLPLLCSHFNSSDERVFVSQQHQHNINKLNGSNWRAVVAGWKEKTLYKLKLIVRVQYEKIHSSRTQTVHLLSLSITISALLLSLLRDGLGYRFTVVESLRSPVFAVGLPLLLSSSNNDGPFS